MNEDWEGGEEREGLIEAPETRLREGMSEGKEGGERTLKKGKS